MLIDVKYDKQFSKKILSGKEYIITELTPNLKKEEKQQITNEVKDLLFQVFKKYV